MPSGPLRSGWSLCGLRNSRGRYACLHRAKEADGLTNSTTTTGAAGGGCHRVISIRLESAKPRQRNLTSPDSPCPPQRGCESVAQVWMHSTDASPPAALLLAQILPVFSVAAPCRTGSLARLGATPDLHHGLAVKLRLKPTSQTRGSVCDESSLGGRSAAAKTDSKAGNLLRSHRQRL
jgi:hypothetical protein